MEGLEMSVVMSERNRKSSSSDELPPLQESGNGRNWEGLEQEHFLRGHPWQSQLRLRNARLCVCVRVCVHDHGKSACLMLLEYYATLE